MRGWFGVVASAKCEKLGFRADINFQDKLYAGNVSEYLTDMLSFSSHWTYLLFPGRFSHCKRWVVIVLTQHLFCDPSVTLETFVVIPAVEVMARCKMRCLFQLSFMEAVPPLDSFFSCMLSFSLLSGKGSWNWSNFCVSKVVAEEYLRCWRKWLLQAGWSMVKWSQNRKARRQEYLDLKKI